MNKRGETIGALCGLPVVVVECVADGLRGATVFAADPFVFRRKRKTRRSRK